MAITGYDWTPTSRAATSYSSVARADIYFAQRPNSADWTAANADEKAQALITGTRAIDAFPGIIDARFTNFNADQALLFPRWNGAIGGSASRTGVATGSSANTLVDTGLANNQTEPDDYWNYGAVRITSGTGSGQVLEVTDFVSSTGTLTVVENWVTNPDTTSNYELIQAIPDDIFYACCIISLGYTPDATTGVIDDGSIRAKLQSQGVKQFSIENHSETFELVNGFNIPISAKQILAKYVARCY